MSTKIFKHVFHVVLILVLSKNMALASHDVGAEVRIECVNACTLSVNFKGYRDCAGAPSIATTPTWISANPNCPNPPVQISTPTVLVTEVTPVCPLVPTACNNPNATVHGVEEHAWSILYNTCNASPCEFDLFFQDCCRNIMITSLLNPGSLFMGVFVTGIDVTAPTCNNSPSYTNIPVAHLCEGQSRVYAMGATDPDGDSLVYALAPCLETSVPNVVPYLPGYSPTSPLGPSWNCTIDAQTGLLHFVAQPGDAEVGVVCVTTSEYRNGNLIATNTRDMQVVVLNCNGINNPPTIGPVTVVSGNAVVVGTDVYVCAQMPFCIDIAASDSDPGQVFSFYWNHALAGATFADASNSNVTDTVWSYFGNAITGRLCWNAANAGTYPVVLSARDNFCPVTSGVDTVLTIHVVPQPFVNANANLVACLQYDFVGSAGGCGTSGNMTYLWTGGGGIASTAPSFTHHFPVAGSYPWQLIVDDGQGYRDTIRDTVQAVQTLNWANFITGNTPIDHCNTPTSCTLDAGNGYANYQWSTGATSQTIAVAASGTYTVTVQETTGCLLRDSESVTAVPADISGHVTSHLAQPMANQRVRLLRLQPSPLALLTIDSTLTDASGYYQFCNISDTNVYAKVHPSVSAFPLDMPTYADSALVWNLAHVATPLLSGPTIRNIHTRYGQNPGGVASLGGIVSQGSNKVDSIGDPVPGFRIFLRHVGMMQIIGYRDTDSNGQFLFPGLPLGDYEVIPDFPYVDHNLPPSVTLSATLIHRDLLDFRLHPTWLELVTSIDAMDPTTEPYRIMASPNPCDRALNIDLTLPKSAKVTVQLYDLAGRQVTVATTYQLARGQHGLPLDIATLAKGVYCMRVQVGDRMHVLRIVKG